MSFRRPELPAERTTLPVKVVSITAKARHAARRPVKVWDNVLTRNWISWFCLTLGVACGAGAVYFALVAVLQA